MRFRLTDRASRAFFQLRGGLLQGGEGRLGVGRGVKDGYMSGHAGGQADRAAQPGPQDDPGHQLNGHGGQNHGEDLDEGQ